MGKQYGVHSVAHYSGPARLEPVECVYDHDSALAYIIRSELRPEETYFPTPPDTNLQCGFVVYPKNKVIPRHVHLPTERLVVGSSEVIMVQKGRCEIDIYSEDRELIATAELREGDIVLTVSGGHGFRTMEDTVLFEVKQGPYSSADKERF